MQVYAVKNESNHDPAESRKKDRIMESWLSKLTSVLSGVSAKVTAEITTIETDVEKAVPTSESVVSAAAGGNLDDGLVTEAIDIIESHLSSWLTAKGAKLGIPSSYTAALVADVKSFITHDVEPGIDNVLHITPPVDSAPAAS